MKSNDDRLVIHTLIRQLHRMCFHDLPVWEPCARCVWMIPTAQNKGYCPLRNGWRKPKQTVTQFSLFRTQ